MIVYDSAFQGDMKYHGNPPTRVMKSKGREGKQRIGEFGNDWTAPESGREK
jgi:hypothetical protein